MHSNIRVADIDFISNVGTKDSMKRLATIFIAAAIVAPLAYVALATAAGMVS